MPCYYIDTDDDVLSVRDEEGQELANDAAAREMAHRVLPEMARQRLPDGEHRTLTAAVRDEAGTVLYIATLSLMGEWKVPRSDV